MAKEELLELIDSLFELSDKLYSQVLNEVEKSKLDEQRYKLDEVQRKLIRLTISADNREVINLIQELATVNSQIKIDVMGMAEPREAIAVVARAVGLIDSVVSFIPPDGPDNP